MVNITDSLLTSMGNRRTSIVCTIDLSAAFDTVSHSTLSSRLDSDFGLTGVVGQWLQSYTTGRTQFVKVGSATGALTAILSGVPQGSVLGPLLFTAYMSPISRLIASYGINQHHYADDTTLFIKLSDSKVVLPSQLQQCVDDIVEWCLRNDMQINPDKTEALLIGSAANIRKHDCSQNLPIGGTNVKLQDSVKIIGVTLDSVLSFDKHTSNVVQSCNYHMRALKHVRPLLSNDLANELACSIVATRLDYCNAILYNMSKGNFEKLQRVQNNLARIVCKAPARTSANALLAKLHWLPIEQRIKYKIATLTFNAIETESPAYMRNSITMYAPPRTLRSSTAGLLTIPDCTNTLAAASRAFRVAAPTVWNALKPETRACKSVGSFKRLLKTELFVAAFNSVNP